MSLSDLARSICVLGLILAAACGYSPALAPSSSAMQQTSQLRVEPPDNRNEFLYVQALEKTLGRTQTPTYTLSYVISTNQDGIGTNPDQEVFRNSIFGTVTYSVIRADTGAVVTTGSVNSFTSFSVGSVDLTKPSSTSASISSVAAERDAKARLMVILAELTRARLIATADAWDK